MFGPRKDYLPRRPFRQGKPRRERPMRKAGKYAKLWRAEKRKQDRVCDGLDYSGCEIRLPGCTFKHDTGQAHSLKRRFTRKQGLDETVRACWNCHTKTEGTPRMRELVLWIRAHRNEEYFICECLTPVTPPELKVDREVSTGVTCDECHLKKLAA